MVMKLVVMMTFAALAAADSPPHFWEKAVTARWLVHKLDYAVLSTTSSQLDGIAFGNPQSFSDGPVDSSTGKLYFYASDLDASMQDLQKDSKCSLTLSLQMLGDYCTKEWAPISKQIDPEDPRCTRLTILGKMRNVTDKDEIAFANTSLFTRHPGMASWPESHDFHFVTLDIENLWLIDMFGGASLITPKDYFAAKAPKDSVMDLVLPEPIRSSPPPAADKAQTARWMAHNLTYGVMSTQSVQYPGYAFGNPQSFVDGSAENSTGHLYFYVSGLDASIKDIDVDAHCSFTLSEEMSNSYCSAGDVDPEDPRCGRLVFSGVMRNTTGDEFTAAKANLFERHPGMKSWPADHTWRIMTLDLSHIWLIDYFGGAAIIKPADYYTASF